MARGRLFSRKYEPAKPRSPEELEKSPNPLVQLGLAFKKLQKLAPEVQPSPASGVEDNVNPRLPLVDINDVRKYLREKLGITKEISTIPPPNLSPLHHADVHLHSPDAETNPSETTHLSSKHSYSSDASSLPTHDAAPGARTFDIGTVGHPILEVNEPRQTISSSSAGSDQPSSVISEMRDSAQRASFKSPARRDRSPTTTTLEVSNMEQEVSTRFEVTESSAGMDQPSTIILEVNETSRRVPQDQASASYTWIVEPPSSDETRLPQLDMKDVQEFVRGAVEVYKRFENWGLPQTSWVNKMPWHSPPPKILSRSLQRPPRSFASEEERLEFNRRARKRKKFLTGRPPTWSFMLANLALIGFLVYNPLG
ncbi:hypothetical protein KC19_3G133700 [Ceratodon purpureus]|uniref:Uncharacterized protein n=1 Tax=Ceratodon purpureus TaxID=3225 RepID=A0A8T0IKL3_CERPU|nr:hypothetical protein KC19_3G133700 [Ceratodon purpureus]